MNEEEYLEYEDKQFEDFVKDLGDHIYLQNEKGEWIRTEIGWIG